ncbi:hypothetical protein MKX01_033055, partial [Papaver californicum]
ISSVFIGARFILKKLGLKRAAAAGTRARVGGHTYLLEPLWWEGMLTMIVGEVANFVAYIFAPAVLVTPLGALSIKQKFHGFVGQERLKKMGVLGCVSCIVGSVVIVIHAPQERTPSSVQEIWNLAAQPAFLFYAGAIVAIVLALMLYFEPRYGQTNVLVYVGICSLMGSMTVIFEFLIMVMSIKAIGIAIKLTLEGISQLTYPQTWFFFTIAVICVITPLNYLNKAITIDMGNSCTNIFLVQLSNVYGFGYLQHGNSFSSLLCIIYHTDIIASAIMYKDWSGQDASSIASEICGFVTILCGTIILHSTREQEPTPTGTIFMVHQ